ncbi:hypothetical protein N752_17850 [Desulforamulus aquiferis]|nr:hypothetical protein N752_17850 [Desulforamulus aquiferis]
MLLCRDFKGQELCLSFFIYAFPPLNLLILGKRFFLLPILNTVTTINAGIIIF